MLINRLVYSIPYALVILLVHYSDAAKDTKSKGAVTTPSSSIVWVGESFDPQNRSAAQQCASKWSKKFPHVKKRFSDVELSEHCKHGASWVKMAREGPKKQKLLSDAQINWLMGIWKCKDLLCVCNAVPLCNKFLNQLSSGFTKLKGLGDNLNTKFNDLDSFFKNVSSSTKPSSRKKRQTLQQINDVIQGKVGKAVRKEIRMLNNEERNAFFRGINRLKEEKIGDKNKYDILVIYHTPEQSPEAHFCASFFPFHRELLKSIEVAMRELEPMAALPYWDPTLDQPLPYPPDSVLWTDEFMGGDGSVATGPFGNWMSLPDAQLTEYANSMKIQRALGRSPYGSLLKDSDIDTLLSKTSFREMSYCVDPFAELIHGTTHLWVGGHMSELRTSPNDPVFFLYHGFLDSVWERWRQQKQSRDQRETDYPSDAESCNSFCTAQAVMKPFLIKNADGLSNMYTDQIYAYEPKPACSPDGKGCGSPYLFCDSRTSKCVAKVKINGNCTGFESQDVCYKSRCGRQGRCVQDDAAASTVAPTFPPSTTAMTTAAAARTTAAAAATTVAGRRGPAATTTARKTTTTTMTMPPTLVTVPPTLSVLKTVWIPITVVNQIGTTTTAYPDAAIISTDTIHGVKFTGVVSDASKLPYYTGAAFAQVLNPFSVTDNVQTTIQVFDMDNRECTSMCLSPTSQLYEVCTANVSLSSNILSTTSDVAYSPDFEQARILNWKGNRKMPDKFFFVCHAAAETTLPIEIVTALPTTTVASSNVVIKNQTGGISIDITSKTDITAKIMNEGCRNLHRCCIIWSGVGECKRNPWMQISCQRDCGVCQDGVDLSAAGCIDYHTDCQKWAANKQCNKNPNWMEENCKKSCGLCQRNMAQLLVICGASGGAEKCIDTDDKCKQWAQDQECERNPWWMKENCAVSCNSCKNKNNRLLFL